MSMSYRLLNGPITGAADAAGDERRGEERGSALKVGRLSIVGGTDISK
jgi:hypothetical protein